MSSPEMACSRRVHGGPGIRASPSMAVVGPDHHGRPRGRSRMRSMTKCRWPCGSGCCLTWSLDPFHPLPSPYLSLVTVNSRSASGAAFEEVMRLREEPRDGSAAEGCELGGAIWDACGWLGFRERIQIRGEGGRKRTCASSLPWLAQPQERNREGMMVRL